MGNPVALSELEKALDDLLMQDAPPYLDDTDITVQRLASRAKCGGPKARQMLEDWTKAGRVEYIGMRREPRGHKVRAWRVKGSQ